MNGNKYREWDDLSPKEKDYLIWIKEDTLTCDLYDKILKIASKKGPKTKNSHNKELME